MDSKKEKRTYADHLDAHPEIITWENLKALRSHWRRSRADTTALASRLKVPNDANRDSLRSLRMFLGTLCDPVRRALIIREKGIVAGSELVWFEGSKRCSSNVQSIGRDHMIKLEDGSRLSPLALVQE